MEQKQRTLELHRSAFETQEEADRMVAYWATRNIKIVWGVPTLAGAAEQLKLPADHPKRQCPGCQKDVPLHYAHWRQQIRPDGMPGRFLMFCRKCEDHRKGFSCRECKKHRPGSYFKSTGSGRRIRICQTCVERPLEKRKINCSKCGKRRKGTEFRFKDEANTVTTGACLPCERKYWSAIRKPRARKNCIECKQKKDNDQFDLGPKGNRRQWTCRACIANRMTDQPRACTSCREVKEAGMFSFTCYRPGERKTVCKACVSRVQAYKNRRARARARVSHPKVATPMSIHPSK